MNLRDLSVGDTLTNPAFFDTYRILSMDSQLRFNDTRRKWGLKASCVWLDTNVQFTHYIPENGLLTVEHKKI